MNAQPREANHQIARDAQQRPGSWRDELGDILRAIGGGFIFAIPLLYTMEMWTIGTTAELWKLLVFLGVALLISLALARSRSGGFKEETHPFAAVEQAVDGVAVGIIGAAIVLVVLNRIQPGDPLESTLGKIIAQAVPIAIGAAVASAVFGPSGERSRAGDDDESAPQDTRQALLADLGATAVGSIFLAFSIAPTEEVALLAAELTTAHLVALVGLSLLVSYVIVFASGYGSGQREQPGPFQSPLAETVLAYVVALLVALSALALFDRVEVGDPPREIISQVLVLSFPATVGGAAGRLVV